MSCLPGQGFKLPRPHLREPHLAARPVIGYLIVLLSVGADLVGTHAGSNLAPAVIRPITARPFIHHGADPSLKHRARCFAILML